MQKNTRVNTTNNKRPYDKVRNAFRDRVCKDENLKLSNPQWSVCMALAEIINASTGQCNPSLATISEYCKLSVSTVQRALKELIDLGLVSSTAGGGKQYGRSNYYTLHPDVDLDAVDNRNKHQGNTDNLQPSYSPTPTPVELENAEDDFEVEDVTPTAVVVPQNHHQPRTEYLSRHDGVANPSQVLTDGWDF